jgi:hypothetical protein
VAGGGGAMVTDGRRSGGGGMLDTGSLMLSLDSMVAGAMDEVQVRVLWVGARVCATWVGVPFTFTSVGSIKNWVCPWPARLMGPSCGQGV